jgi:hypothetical protein
MSPHYADQAAMFVAGKTRAMLMDREDIVRQSKNRLVLMPQ